MNASVPEHLLEDFHVLGEFGRETERPDRVLAAVNIANQEVGEEHNVDGSSAP